MNEIGMVNSATRDAVSRPAGSGRRSSETAADLPGPATTGLRATYSPRELMARFAAPSLNRSLVGLSRRERESVQRLADRDRVVRLHEARHAAALGASAGVTRYVFQVGPDGRSYAVGGSIEVSAMPGNTPEETIAKARMLRAAALAGGEPSGADFAMATEAQRMEQSARIRLQG